MNCPLVSCILPTYNMPRRLPALNEAVESFVRQDYPNRELIIIIDSPGQILSFSHHNVIVLNYATRFSSLGEKLNAAVANASGEFLCRWDDDDIPLPTRISSQVAKLQEGYDYVTAGTVWTLDGDRLTWAPQTGWGHSQGMMRMQTFVDVGGYANTSGDEDAAMHQIIIGDKARWRSVSLALPPETTPFIYRWNQGLDNISGYTPRHMPTAYARNALDGTTGMYAITPRWQRDYACLTRAVSTSLATTVVPPPMASMSLCVVGLPSAYGGAGTELDHQITLWRALGIDVHLIPTRSTGYDFDLRGCTLHSPLDWSACEDKHVISYGEPEFLANAGEIHYLARSTTFVNCMTFLTDAERDAHAAGLIDWFLYQTDHARLLMEPTLRSINSRYQWAKVRPFFDASRFPYVPDRPANEFTFCRISRDDPSKFSADTMQIFDRIGAMNKRGTVLGVSPAVLGKTGPAPAYVECLPPGARPVKDVLADSYCLIQSSDGLENLPRVGMEAMATGTIIIADNRGGWKELVAHNRTGFLCDNQFDFVMAATALAQHPEKRPLVALAARKRVVDEFGFAASARDWSTFMIQLAACS